MRVSDHCSRDLEGWTADNSIDLEVLAILHLGLRDRRTSCLQMRIKHLKATEATALAHCNTRVGHSVVGSLRLRCQCLFFHDLRVKELPEASSLDALQIMDIICKAWRPHCLDLEAIQVQVCGEEILLEAFEKDWKT